jgi:hypothetical protein
MMGSFSVSALGRGGKKEKKTDRFTGASILSLYRLARVPSRKNKSLFEDEVTTFRAWTAAASCNKNQLDQTSKVIPTWKKVQGLPRGRKR